jgi:hypothetical protein
MGQRRPSRILIHTRHRQPGQAGAALKACASSVILPISGRPVEFPAHNAKGPCGCGRRGGHLSWRCRKKCDDMIYVPALTADCRLLAGPHG